ncbi:MAG TPA: glutathione-disulfide reductase [Cellvibrio sp.]|nr:glutathione-disulfide reductase [Cellvibrio sp.]
MSAYTFDLFVIGAGSGGVRASRTAAQLGARVAIAEESNLGGTCVNVGCVPKKLLVYSAHYRDTLHLASGFGWNIRQAHFDWATLRENKNTEIARLNQVYHRLLTGAGVTLLKGRARIVNPHCVQVGEQVYTTERILIATGGYPVVPEFPGSEHVITSNEAFFLDQLPEKILLVGGGYISVEFAGIFNGLGVETHLCHRSDALLKGFDQDIRQLLGEELIKKGVHLHFNTDITRIEKVDENRFTAHAKDGREWCVNKIMFATGRRPNIANLGLENTAIQPNKNGTIAVDKHYQTVEPSIYAVGDVVGHLALTPIALAEGMLLARHLFDKPQQALNYHGIPTAVFSQPPVASVGLSEADARENYAAVDVYQSHFKPMAFSLSDTEERTFIKLLVDRHTDKVVGCHMLGPDAAEIMQGLAVALTAGATKQDFDRTIGIHPTLAEEFVTLRERHTANPD